MAGSGAEIEGDALTKRGKVCDGADMGFGKVGYVDVIAHGRAVLGRIVGTEDDWVGLSQCCPDHQRYEMSLGIVILADLAVRIGPGSIDSFRRCKTS